MKNIIMNLLLSVLAIVVCAVAMTALSSIYSESFIEVVNNFVGSIIILSAVAIVTVIVALLIKGIRVLIHLIPGKKHKPLVREYSFNIWMKYWSKTRQKLLTTVTVEASSQSEAEDKIRGRYSKLLYDLERI